MIGSIVEWGCDKLGAPEWLGDVVGMSTDASLGDWAAVTWSTPDLLENVWPSAAERLPDFEVSAEHFVGVLEDAGRTDDLAAGAEAVAGAAETDVTVEAEAAKPAKLELPAMKEAATRSAAAPADGAAAAAELSVLKLQEGVRS